MTKSKRAKRKLFYEGIQKVQLLGEEKECFFCGSSHNVEHHHVFGGANRDHSEHCGLVVYLCDTCHRDKKKGVHSDAEKMLELKQIGQREFERLNGHEEFMRIFRRNSLEVEDGK